MHTGGCYCGAIRYEAHNATSGGNCHCSICRRTTGAPFVTWLTVPRSGFRIVRGEPKRFRSSATATRSFCATCGTQLTFARDDLPNEIDVTVGSLDDPNSAPPRYHIFVPDKVAWLNLGDDLPRYEQDFPGP